MGPSDIILRMSSNKFETLIMELRATELVRSIRDFVVGESVLDVGSGSGFIAKALRDQFLRSNDAKTVKCVDVKNYHKVDLPFQMYDGLSLPFEDNSFDTVIFVYVLHHTDNQHQLLTDAKRVARSRVLVVEDLFVGNWNRKWLSVLDFVINRMYHNVVTPLTFRDFIGWNSFLCGLGFRKVTSRDLRVGLLTKLGIKKVLFCCEI